MKVLVTGGAGYIGSHTTRQLLNAGHEVVVYDNLSSGSIDAIPANTKFIKADILDTELLCRVMTEEKIEAVIHFAAKLIVSESVHQPLEYYENNTMGVLSLVKSCVAAGVSKVVFSSTAAVYGDSVTDGLICESTATSPLNPYGSSKYMSEEILRDSESAHGIHTVILRYFNVAGASNDGVNGQRTKASTHLIKVAAEAAVGKRSKLQVYGTDYPTSDGTCIRDYIHVEDLADIHVHGLDYLVRGGKTEIFNCGYGYGFSVLEVVDMVKKVSSEDFIVEVTDRRAGDAASLVASTSRLKNIFGWKPKYDSLELICRSAVLWEKQISS